MKTRALIFGARFALVCLLGLAAAGCALPTEVVYIGMDQAVGRYIEESATPAARAERIAAIATNTLRRIDSLELTTVASVGEFFRSRVPWGELKPSDQRLAENLIAIMQRHLDGRVGAGELAGDTLVPVREVLQQAIDTAARY